uniref:Uncharacterized protein n=1 Tax=Sphaerodactylus townsendi TaxID=933632 RepID=A0ACB8GDZ9_9SAUR
MYLSILFLASISVDRFLGVVYPIKYKMHRRPVYALVICVCFWMLVCSHCSIIYIYRYGGSNESIPYSPNTSHCYDNFSLQQLRVIYSLRLELCLFFFCFPFIITLFCYVKVIHLLSSLSNVKPSKKRRAVGLAVATLLNFIICFAPYNVSHMAIQQTINECWGAMFLRLQTVVFCSKHPTNNDGVDADQFFSSGVLPNLPSIPPNLPGGPPNLPGVLQNLPVIQPKSPGVPPKLSDIPPKLSDIPPNLAGVLPNVPSIPPNLPGGLPNLPGVPPNLPVIQPKSPGIPPILSDIPPNLPGILPKLPAVDADKRRAVRGTSEVKPWHGQRARSKGLIHDVTVTQETDLDTTQVEQGALPVTRTSSNAEAPSQEGEEEEGDPSEGTSSEPPQTGHPTGRPERLPPPLATESRLVQSRRRLRWVSLLSDLGRQLLDQRTAEADAQRAAQEAKLAWQESTLEEFRLRREAYVAMSARTHDLMAETTAILRGLLELIPCLPPGMPPPQVAPPPPASPRIPPPQVATPLEGPQEAPQDEGPSGRPPRPSAPAAPWQHLYHLRMETPVGGVAPGAGSPRGALIAWSSRARGRCHEPQGGAGPDKAGSVGVHARVCQPIKLWNPNLALCPVMSQATCGHWVSQPWELAIGW